MALADYYLCDVCGRKTFYDARVDYDSGHLGDMKCICQTCAHTHRVVVVEKEATDGD